jgi:LuxR family transcriptional regulator, maltose regulon positive regulatory protein
MIEPLLQTKLNVPPLRSGLIPRRRLIERLNAGWGGRLILISAPAGYGKTTLVAEWLSSLPPVLRSKEEGMGARVAWLSLEEGDNDPRRFLGYLLAALKHVNAEIGRPVEAMLRSPQPPPDKVILTALVNEILAVSQPIMFVVDDYHVIHAPPIHEQINFLLEHQPAQMHVVLITREDPPLPLPRLRARGQMVEIRQEDLRFSLEECADFLNQAMGLNLSATDVAALEHRTEGWIAGLQLAALSMRGSDDLPGFIQAFTGSSHYILDYLIEEVFKQQTAETQDFLLRTSILDRLSGPLCDAVAGRTGSRSLLEHLEHANLFIIPLDQSCTWYRYHHLFVELLRQRLQVTETISEKGLHALACQWFTDEGLFPEAIQHALAGPEWERAAELIQEYSVSLLRRGELGTLMVWLKALPEEVIRKHPQLCRDYGWVLTLTGQLEAAKTPLDCAEKELQGDDMRLGQVIVAQAYLARARGDYLEAIELSKKALTLIGESDILSRGLVTFTLGFAHFNAGHLAEAERALLEASHLARLSGNDFTRLTALGLLGAIQMNQGRLQRAAESCRQALQEAGGSPMAAQVQEFLALILYEWNDLLGAGEQLEQALKASQYLGNRAIQMEILRARVCLKQAQGDPVAALEELDVLHQLAQESDSSPGRALAAACHVSIAIAQGDLASAEHWIQQIVEGIDPAAAGLQYGLVQARLLLAQGKQVQVGEILTGLYQAVSQAGLVSSLIEVRALQSMAATTPADALHFLENALEQAQPEGFIRTFVDKGEPLRLLIADYRSQIEKRTRHASEESLVRMSAYTSQLLAAFSTPTNASTPKSTIKNLKSEILFEPLSERELEILRLLAMGLSNRAIAERLVISVGTTKSHVHNILEKMGSESRMQAVAKARELGLV